MFGRTHFVLGIASALVITRPQTVSGVITAMAGGSLGGWIVDIDMRDKDLLSEKHEQKDSIWDFLLKGLFFLAFLIVDYLTGRGMYRYIVDNWSVKVWGALFGILILLLIGFNTKHRTFTHSFLAMGLFYGLMYFFCRPAAIPLLIGYASHLLADYLNIKGPQLFFPLPWKPSLKMCESGDKKVNEILFWSSFAVSVLLGSFLFAKGMMEADQRSAFITSITEKKLFGFNAFQLYLIFSNLITFFGYRRDWRLFDESVRDAEQQGVKYDYKNYETPLGTLAVWMLNILVFFGAGIGMLIALILEGERPNAYNGKWWAFLYATLLFWFTVYCWVCNPFGHVIQNIVWFSRDHISLFVFLLGINAVTALVLFTFRKKNLSDSSKWHTFFFLLGALGGTIGSIAMVFYLHRHEGAYKYIAYGFPFMLISQIIFIMYLMTVGVF